MTQCATPMVCTLLTQRYWLHRAVGWHAGQTLIKDSIAGCRCRNHERDWPGTTDRAALDKNVDSGGECGVVYDKRMGLGMPIMTRALAKPTLLVSHTRRLMTANPGPTCIATAAVKCFSCSGLTSYSPQCVISACHSCSRYA